MNVYTGSVRVAATVILVLTILLHLPVFTQGALVTPAGMHHAMWPWKATMAEVAAGDVLLEENHTLSDLLFQVYPWQLHISRSLGAGAIPLWNPFSYAGVPFVGNAQSAVFYPLHWPAWLIPSMHVFTAALLMKIILAGLFMAVFLRGLGCSPVAAAVGAVSFALCGFMTSWLGYAHTNAAIMLPLLMHGARLAATKPGADSVLFLALAGAANYLGGHPETSLHIVGASGLYFLWLLRESPRPRLSWGLFAGGSLLGFLLASIQMFPFIRYLLDSAALQMRQSGPGVDPSLPPTALAAWLLPNLFGRPEAYSYDGPAAFQATAGYFGVGVLLLAVASILWYRRCLFFQLLAVISCVVVYGPSWLHSIIRHIPVIGISSNNRLLLLIAFCAAVLAALALDRLAQGGE